MVLLWSDAQEGIEDVPAALVEPMSNRLALAVSLGTPTPPSPGVAVIRMLGWLLLCDRFAAAAVQAIDACVAF